MGKFRQFITEAEDIKQKQMNAKNLKHVGYGNYKDKQGNLYYYSPKKHKFIKDNSKDIKVVDALTGEIVKEFDDEKEAKKYIEKSKAKQVSKINLDNLQKKYKNKEIENQGKFYIIT